MWFKTGGVKTEGANATVNIENGVHSKNGKSHAFLLCTATSKASILHGMVRRRWCDFQHVKDLVVGTALMQQCLYTGSPSRTAHLLVNSQSKLAIDVHILIALRKGQMYERGVTFGISLGTNQWENSRGAWPAKSRFILKPLIYVYV